MSEITEFRLHGRGGQGIVVAAAVFAEAVFREGLYARAFSLFGAERRGAPVTAFVRVSAEPLMPRCRIYEPDFVAAMDATISRDAILAGLKKEGTLLINSGEAEPSLLQGLPTGLACRQFLVDAVAIASLYDLAIGGFPVVNTVMVGALARISGLASLENVIEAMQKRVGSRHDANIKAVTDGYRQVKEVSGVVG